MAMREALLLTLAIPFCIVSSVQCHVGPGKDHLTRHIRSRTSKPSSSYVTVESLDNKVEYLPVYLASQTGLKEGDKITALPGQPDGINFDQYSGYVTVDAKAGRALFYWLVESQNSSSKPLVLWLQGGPGCSAVGNGAFTELGPFRVNSDRKTLWRNPHAWNNAANMLFLESPAGVGFSYSNTSSDYTTGDKRTAADSYTFLINWLERFPEYKTRDFFITGESYAGHYVPQIAQLILKNNITKQTVINLKGIAVGNAYIDIETQNRGTNDFLWSHALISDEIYEGINSNCNFSTENYSSDACAKYHKQADEAQGNIDAYNIFAPVCDPSSKAPPLRSDQFDPCTDEYISGYLNTPEVQHAFHVNITGSLPGPWVSCSDPVFYNWNDEPDSVLDVIKQLTTGGINVWLYSGDTDSVVAVTTTRYAIKKMNFSVKTPWYPWYDRDEVGGYAVGYGNFSFVTVRGTGHFVPSYQPVRALAMFTSFLAGKLPPSSKEHTTLASAV